MDEDVAHFILTLQQDDISWTVIQERHAFYSTENARQLKRYIWHKTLSRCHDILPVIRRILTIVGFLPQQPSSYPLLQPQPCIGS